MEEKVAGMTEFTEIELKDKKMTKSQFFEHLHNLLKEYNDNQMFERINLCGRVGVDIPVGEIKFIQ